MFPVFPYSGGPRWEVGPDPVTKEPDPDRRRIRLLRRRIRLLAGSWIRAIQHYLVRSPGACQGARSGSFGPFRAKSVLLAVTLVPGVPGVPGIPAEPRDPVDPGVVYLWSFLIAFGQNSRSRR